MIIQTERKTRAGRTAAANSTLAIGGFSFSADSFVVIKSSVIRTNFCAKKPSHRKSANRCLPLY